MGWRIMELIAKAKNGTVTLNDSGIIITGKIQGVETVVEFPFKKLKGTSIALSDNGESGIFIIRTKNRGDVKFKFNEDTNEDFLTLHKEINEYIEILPPYYKARRIAAIASVAAILIFLFAWFNSTLNVVRLASNIISSQGGIEATANIYLNTSSFSRSGLISQLLFHGYSREDATEAVDNLNIDWNEQALGKAQEYLSVLPYSRQGLIDQLIFEGFTQEQADYGADAVGFANDAQDISLSNAERTALNYLSFMAFSRSGLIAQLEFEGYS